MKLEKYITSFSQLNFKLDKELDKLSKNDNSCPNVIFGTGKAARNLYSQLVNWYNINILYFCESDNFYKGGLINGVPCLSISEITNILSKFNLIISASGPGSYETIKTLTSNSNIDINLFNLSWLPGMYNITPDWVSRNREKLGATYDLLADTKSKEIFLSIIESRTHCLNVLTPPLSFYYDGYSECVYFNDLYKKTSNHYPVLIDCGAFNGWSSEYYIDFINRNNIGGGGGGLLFTQ